MKVAAVGYSCMDVYDNLDRSYPTGNGVDFALNIKKKGIHASVVSAVGKDRYGEQMLKTLAESDIDISHLRIEKGSTAVIHMQLINNDRVHGYSTDGVMANYYLTESDFEFIKQHDYIHTDYFGRVYGLLPEFKKAGCQVVFDFSEFLEDKDIHLIMPHVDYALFSYSGHDQWIEDKMKWAHSQGVKVVVATFGEKGSLAFDGQQFYEGAITKVEKVTNTVGAGDSFFAGFMAGIINQLSIPECLQQGADLAANVIQRFEPY
ncbi:fructoselysine 6-kinase [Bacillus rubiinfantis]|uniref:fructoselysine 6-kinase n=1 Tax=Bacillus rubiinfantis TaxID=1499680 RepID=UPI0005A76F06|nr:fructoselysine 6-kinase [Bacillus rubiinfantis]